MELLPSQLLPTPLLPARSTITRRRLLSGTAAISAVAALAAACGTPGEQPGGGTVPTPAPAPAKLIWLIRSDMGVLINDWHQKTATSFMQENPRLTVELSGATSDDYNTKATTMFVGGTPPDVMSNYGGGFGTFIVNHWLLDITPYTTRQKFDLKTFEPAALNAIRREGKLYGQPVAHNPWLLFHNRSLLQERGAALPPTTWKDKRWNLDALLKAAQQVTTLTGDPATATWGIVHPPGQMGTQACWLWGVDPFGPAGPDKTTAYQTGKITDVNYLQPRVVEALQTIEQDLAFKYRVAPSPAEQAPFVAGRPTPLHTGRLGFWAGGGWLIQNFKVGDVTFKWGVAPLAYGLGTSAANTTGLFNDSFHVANGTKVPDAAFLLVMYIATGDRARGYTEGGGHFPANRAGYDAWFEETLRIPGFGMTKTELQQVMLEAMETGFPSPGKTVDRQRDFASAYEKAVAPIRNGQQPAAIGLRDVQQQIEAIIRQG